LFAVPQLGSYFAYWGNGGSGTNNPLSFTITSTSPTVSSLFGTLSSTQVSVVAIPDGLGRVTVNPPANRHPKGSTVTVTAVPALDQSFLGWAGMRPGWKTISSWLRTKASRSLPGSPNDHGFSWGRASCRLVPMDRC